MKKIINKFLLIITILILSGCASKEKVLNETYEKMQLGNDLDSYRAIIIIKGNVDKKKVNQIMAVSNYKNEQFQIDDYIANSSDTNLEIQNNVVYVVKDKQYKEDAEGKLIELTKKVSFINPNIYIDNIKNIKKKISEKEEKIDKLSYKKYTVKIDKDSINEMLKGSNIDYKVKKDQVVDVSIDSNDYIYQVKYTINEGKCILTIDVDFFQIGGVLDIYSMFPLK